MGAIGTVGGGTGSAADGLTGGPDVLTVTEGLTVEVEVDVNGACWCLVTGEPSPPGCAFVKDASGVKTSLVTARPNALMEEGNSGNKGVPGTMMGGGLNAGGVDVPTVVLGSTLRYLTMLFI
jgi:hypothetical protein